MTSLGNLRLPQQPAEWLDRAAAFAITFEDQSVSAYAGDSVASALWANRCAVLGHSLKQRRPRGLGAGVLLDDEERGVIAAEQTPARPGMRLRRVHDAAPSGAVPSWAGHGPKLASGGLYDPARLGDDGYERQVRSWVGLQRYDATASQRVYGKRHEHAEVLVIGAGLAGMAAALSASSRGRKVIVLEADRLPGGAATGDPAASDELARMLERLQVTPSISLRVSTIAVGIYADQLVAAVAHGGLTKVRADKIVLATGTTDIPAIFRNNDLPGVMTSSVATRLVHRYAVAPGLVTVVLTCNDEGHQLATALLAAGVHVEAVVDSRPLPGATQAAVRTFQHALIEEAHAGRAGTLDGVSVIAHDGKRTTLTCDALVVSAGTTPADQLAIQARASYLPSLRPLEREVAPGVWSAGSVRRAGGASAAVRDGTVAGQLASGAQLDDEAVLVPDQGDPELAWAMPMVADARGGCIVDFDEDVELADIEGAIDEGFDQSALLSAYTKVGRGYHQGRSSHVNALRVLSAKTGQALGAVGRPLARPPLTPVPMAMLAGRSVTPRRRTPLHEWHARHGAEFLIADEWERPAVYRGKHDRDRESSVAREVMAVRQRAGLIDVGTLGKIEVVGPDAALFLEHVYTGRFADLRVGFSRYAVMCDESGVVIDDGMVARFGDHRFYVTTTTSASASVYRELQRAVIQFGLRVGLTQLTGSLTAFNLAGPAALRVLAEAADHPSALSALPYLGALETTLQGTPVRVIRAGFVGEVAYELHLAYTAGLSAWTELMERGREVGLQPVGVRAQRMLRLEKGHLILGQDSDALATPDEIGLQWAVKRDKPFFVGQRSLRIRAQKPRTRVLVGFELAPKDADAQVEECDLVMDGTAIAGRVTSVGRSPTLGKVIGLAFVGAAQVAPGSSFAIRLSRDRRVEARVVPTPFYDPSSARQREALA